MTASPVHRARYSTNWYRKGWPGSEIQMYYGCPWCLYFLTFSFLSPYTYIHPIITPFNNSPPPPPLAYFPALRCLHYYEKIIIFSQNFKLRNILQKNDGDFTIRKLKYSTHNLFIIFFMFFLFSLFFLFPYFSLFPKTWWKYCKLVKV